MTTSSRNHQRLLFCSLLAWWVCAALPVPAQSPLYLQLQSNSGRWNIQWPAHLQNAQGVDQAPLFELQFSPDLRTWTPLGPTFRASGSSLNEMLVASMPTDAPEGFFRLVASFLNQDQATKLAVGGAEVFGYGPLFAKELRRIGQISTEQFAALYPAPSYAIEQIDFDPTNALYWAEFNTDPMIHNSGIVPGAGSLRHNDFRLNPEETALFKTNGFVVSERLALHSFAEAFFRIWNNDLPVYISTDAILQAWHRTYDSMLEELEETWLAENLDRMLDGMASKIPDAAAQAGTGPMQESVLDADYFLAVARTLLKGTKTPSLLSQQGRVDAAITAIQAQQLQECFDLFGKPRAVDFSQFKVRGHYENSPLLGRYFQSVMWLGRLDLRVAGGPFQDSPCIEPHRADPRELGTAIVLSQILDQSGQFNRWLQFDRVIQAFVGWTDSMTFAQLKELLTAAGVQSIGDIHERDNLVALQDALEKGQYGVQNIRSDYFIAPLNAPLRLPRSFTVFGQKFIPDSWALSKVVYDDILWVENGKTNKICRRVPSCLDVAFAVLGNNHIVPDLVTRITDQSPSAHPFRDGKQYQHNLAALRAVMDQQGSAGWTNNMYVDWLGSLRELSQPLTDSNYPQALRTRAWAMKTLNTQMASWSQLRHDTILYAKQSYTTLGICEFPAFFVEPHPTFWAALRAMIERTAALLGSVAFEGTALIYDRQSNVGGGSPVLNSTSVDLPAIQTQQIGHLQRFAATVTRLESLVQNQLAGAPPSAADEAWVCDLIEQGGALGSGGPYLYNGWYPGLFYRSVHYRRNPAFHQDSGADKWDTIVADVHTDLPSDLPCTDPGSVLHEGIGNVNLLFVAVDVGTSRTMFAGPVLSHFEFELIGSPRRLSDSEWTAAISGQSPIQPPLRPEWRVVHSPRFWDYLGWSPFAPPPPPWTRSYLAPAN